MNFKPYDNPVSALRPPPGILVFNAYMRASPLSQACQSDTTNGVRFVLCDNKHINFLLLGRETINLRALIYTIPNVGH
jgi:hypothetical protein